MKTHAFFRPVPLLIFLASLNGSLLNGAAHELSQEDPEITYLQNILEKPTEKFDSKEEFDFQKELQFFNQHQRELDRQRELDHQKELDRQLRDAIAFGVKDLTCIKNLVEMKADVKQSLSHVFFHDKDRAPIVEFLLEQKGVSVNCKGLNSRLPSDNALIHADLASLKILLDKGGHFSDWVIKDEFDSMPPLYAKEKRIKAQNFLKEYYGSQNMEEVKQLARMRQSDQLIIPTD